MSVPLNTGSYDQPGKPAASKATGLLVVRILAFVAVVVQSALLLGFFAMGLGWAGVFYLANLLQGLTLLILTIIAAINRRRLALLLPLISLLLMVALFNLDRVATAQVCSPARLSAAAQLGPIPGHTESPEFAFEWGRCVARFNSGLPQATVMERYRTAAARAGWAVQQPPSDRKAVMSNPTIIVQVVVNWNDYGMYVMTLLPATDTPTR